MGHGVANPSSSETPEAPPEVNTTPLIDVMLVLLVMLIITIPMQLHDIHYELNGQRAVVAQEPVVHEVFVDFDGTVYWDQMALPDRTAVESRMHEVGRLALADQAEVHLKPNALADYGIVAAVMASAQRNDVRRLAIVGNEQFMH